MGDDAMVVVKRLLDCDEDADVVFGEVGLGCIIPCFSVVMTWNMSIIGI